jgi:flagellar protein FliL
MALPARQPRERGLLPMPVAAADAIPAPKSPDPRKKRLRVLLLALLLVVLGGTCAFLWVLKHQARDDEGDDAPPPATAQNAAAVNKSGTVPAAAAVHRLDPKAPPTFVALDSFTVNLADRDTERYAQLGITLEIADSKVADQIKSYMPAIRNNILMAIADKTAAQLMDREGKLKLAAEIQRETARSIGYTAEAAAAAAAEAAQDADTSARKKTKRLLEPPIRAVHFSNFIIQ